MYFQYGLEPQGEDKTYYDPETSGEIFIGLGTQLSPGVYVAGNVVIGRHCRIGPGTTIGYTGFGYTFSEDTDRWLEKSHDFGVVLENEVHVGANSCIDSGSWRTTHVGRGTKIDNLVHVAHNVRTAKNCMLIAGASLGGSVNLEERVWVGLNACVRQRLTVGKGALVGMGAVVTADVRPDWLVLGVPARHLRKVKSSDY